MDKNQWMHVSKYETNRNQVLQKNDINYDRSFSQAEERVTVTQEDQHLNSEEDRIFEEKSLANDQSSLKQQRESILRQTIEKHINSRNAPALLDLLVSEGSHQLSSSVFSELQKLSGEFYINLLLTGAERNDPFSLHKLAVFLIFNPENRISPEKANLNFERARILLKKSIDLGFHLSYFTLGRLLHEAFHEDDLAFQTASQGSIRGEMYSRCLLGHFTSRGIGTEKDFDRGVMMMLESGKSDYYDRFATDIGIFHVNKKDDKNAFKWFKKAFEMNVSEATVNNLGVVYMSGIGIEKDVEKAEELFRAGAEKGFASSLHHLAYICLLKKKNKEVLEYFKRAADKGNAEALDSYNYLVSVGIDQEEDLFDIDGLAFNEENKEFEKINSEIFIQDK